MLSIRCFPRGICINSNLVKPNPLSLPYSIFIYMNWPTHWITLQLQAFSWGEIQRWNAFIFADLVIMSKTQEGLQQLNQIWDTFCQTWALKKLLIFQNRSRCHGNRFNFKRVRRQSNKCFLYNRKSNQSWNINICLNDIIEPIALHGSELCGPLGKKNSETLFTQVCESAQRNKSSTLLIRIQIKFDQLLKSSDPNSYTFQAVWCQEQNMEKSALSQLVLEISSATGEKVSQKRQYA